MYKPTPSPAVGIDIFNKSEFHPLKYFFDISNFIQLDWIVRKMSASTAKGLYLQREKKFRSFFKQSPTISDHF